MRYPAPEKFEIIRIVEQSHLPVRRTVAQIGIPPTTFHRWYDRYIESGPEGLEDRPSRPSKVWNRIPDPVRDQIVDLALNEPDLSPTGTGRPLHRHEKVSSPWSLGPVAFPWLDVRSFRVSSAQVL